MDRHDSGLSLRRLVGVECVKDLCRGQALGMTFAMISPLRQEMLRKLERISELAPDVRFAQLIANLANLTAGPWDQTLWDLEDEQLVVGVDQLLADLQRRPQNVA